MERNNTLTRTRIDKNIVLQLKARAVLLEVPLVDLLNQISSDWLKQNSSTRLDCRGNTDDKVGGTPAHNVLLDNRSLHNN